MKKINYKSYILGLALLGSMASCKKSFLDRRPEDQIVDANFYQTTDQVLAGTAPLYNLVWFAYNDKASHGLGDGRGGVLFSGSYQIENIEMRSTATTNEVNTAWQSFFNVIGQSNLVINNVNKYAGAGVPENIKQHAIAEARFMRGLAYSYLVQNFGAVPIITNNNTLLQDTTLARNTAESVWEFILRDIRFATENLPPSSLQVGRLNQWAAEGMLAKMYLTRSGVGSTNGARRQTDLDSAKYFAKRAIDNSGATLLQNYGDLFLTQNNNNKESVFALQWKYDGPWGNQNSVQAFLAFSPSITGFGDGWGGDIGASKYIMDKYDPNDKRRKPTFMYPTDVYPQISQTVPDPANPGKTKTQPLVVPVQSKDANTGVQYNARAWVKKYVVGQPQDNAGKVLQQRTEINTYMLRLADLYLIYAEAVLGNNPSTNDPLALEYFNAVRERAGLSRKDLITYDDIFNERLLEFAMEGQAWYDLVRLYYYNPTKALDIISKQDRGGYRVIPNQIPNATSWTIEADPADVTRFFPVTSANFFLPLPAIELTKAPNLNKPPVPYQF
jgi:starch-binding outer membrane protein, SusD/RagB family